MVGEEYTPGPVPVAIMQGNQSAAMPAPPPYKEPPILALWWKQLVVFVGGLAAFGAVAFVIAQAFFVPRSEWSNYMSTMTNAINNMDNRLKNIEDKIKINSESLKSLTERANNLDVLLASEGILDASPPPRRRRHPSK